MKRIFNGLDGFGCPLKQLSSSMPVDLTQFQTLTGQVIGCAMKVHRQLGTGFLEIIYQRALAKELAQNSIFAEREVEMSIYYVDEIIGKRRVDFLVNNQVMLELKAVGNLNPSHQAQLLNYLEVYRLPVGLLLNFGSSSLEFKRVVNPKAPAPSPPH